MIKKFSPHSKRPGWVDRNIKNVSTKLNTEELIRGSQNTPSFKHRVLIQKYGLSCALIKIKFSPRRNLLGIKIAPVPHGLPRLKPAPAAYR